MRKKTKRENNGHGSPRIRNSPRKEPANGYSNINKNGYSNDLSPRPQNGNHKDEHIGTINPRALSLKQLKDMSADILKNKEI